MKNFKYKTSFAANIRCLINEDKDKFLSEASLSNLKDIIPDDVKQQDDLLCIAFNACNVNLANKNGDLIDSNTAKDIYKSFIHKAINLEHSRSSGAIGHITSAGFSKFDINFANGAGSEILQANDIKDNKNPFNISLSGVLYKLYAEKLIDYIEESNDPNSTHYLDVSASWELLFDKFVLAVGSRYLSECEIIDNPDDIEKMSKYLLSSGGTGKTPEGKIISRLLVGEVLPVGIGVTETPAGELKGIVIASKSSKSSMICPECGEKVDMEDDIDEETEHSCAKCGKKSMGNKWKSKVDIDAGILSKIAENLTTTEAAEAITAALNAFTKENLKISQNSNSQSEIKAVNKDTIKNKSNKSMITTIKNITDEVLKEATASEIIKAHKIDLDAEVTRISQEFEEKKNKVDNELKASNEKSTKLEGELNSTKEQLAKVQEDLNKLVKAAADKAAEDTFNARMNYFDTEFELDDKSRNAVANRVKNLDDAAYKQEKEDLETLLAAKKKGFVPFKKKDSKEEEKTEKVDNKTEEKKETKASVEDKANETVVEDAIDKGTKVAAAVAATTTITESNKDKFARIFGKDAWVVNPNVVRK